MEKYLTLYFRSRLIAVNMDSLPAITNIPTDDRPPTFLLRTLAEWNALAELDIIFQYISDKPETFPCLMVYVRIYGDGATDTGACRFIYTADAVALLSASAEAQPAGCQNEATAPQSTLAKTIRP